MTFDWQPIDTAPKDGSQILLADHLVASDGYFEPSANNDKGSWIWPYVLRNPTHWMPLTNLPPKAIEWVKTHSNNCKGD